MSHSEKDSFQAMYPPNDPVFNPSIFFQCPTCNCNALNQKSAFANDIFNINSHHIEPYINSKVEMMKYDETINRKPTPDQLLFFDLKNQAPNSFPQTIIGILSNYLKSDRYTLLEAQVTKHNHSSYSFKNRRLFIEKVNQMTQMHQNSPSNDDSLEDSQSAVRERFRKLFRRTKSKINEHQFEERSSRSRFEVRNVQQKTKKAITKTKFKEKSYHNPNDGQLARNFPKIFGLTVVRFIQEDLFDDKKQLKLSYEKCGFLDKQSIVQFKNWIKECISSEYTKLAIFRKVWKQEFLNDFERKFANLLTELTKLFLIQEAYGYFIRSFGRKFKNRTVVLEYLKCIPIFMQGINEPERLNGLKTRLQEACTNLYL